MISNERAKHQRDYSFELRKVENEITFEADRIRQVRRRDCARVSEKEGGAPHHLSSMQC